MGYIAAGVALVATVVGTAMTMKGQADTADAIKNQGNYQAQVATNNAAIARTNADWTREAGEQQAQTVAMAGRQKVGAVRAAMSANGVDITTGSASDVIAGQEGSGLLDVMTMRSNYTRAAYAQETQATGFEAESALAENRAKSAEAALPYQLGGSLMSGTAQAFNMGSQASAAGLWDKKPPAPVTGNFDSSGP